MVIGHLINRPVSIPQAVSTVATSFKAIAKRLNASRVSIPQAVSTVATLAIKKGVADKVVVSIPQAVSTVATKSYSS